MSGKSDSKIPTHTHLVLPGWWVGAYLAAGRLHGSASAMESALGIGLMPALGQVELASLAYTLHSVAHKLLAPHQEAPEPWIVISSFEQLRGAGGLRTRRWQVEKALQDLARLAVLSGDERSADAYPLFSGAQRWTKVDEQDIHLYLSPSALGPELLLGHTDRHVELVRGFKGHAEAAPILGPQAPLAMGLSLWLDLQGLEQSFYLELEKTVQWDSRSLDLLGAFSLPLSRVFSDARTTGKKSSEQLARDLKQLARLGRKLMQHGLLSEQWGDEFLAFAAPSHESEPQLLFRISRERMAWEATERHLAAASAWLTSRRLRPLSSELLGFLAPQMQAEYLGNEAWQAVWDAAVSPQVLVNLNQPRAEIWSPQGLFLEIWARRLDPSVAPLPDAATAGEFAAIFSPQDSRPLLQRFEAFCLAVQETPEYCRNLSAVAGMSMASSASRKLLERATEVSSHESVPGGEASAGFVAKPRLVPLPRVDLKGRADELPPLEQTLRGADAAMSFAARMRRTAAAELARMQAHDPTQYQDLRKSFFASLDDGARRMMQEVQRQLEPTRFEEQLKPQLIRYMVEHPTTWSSAQQRLGDGSRPR